MEPERDEKWTKASFSIFSECLTADQIGAELNLKATETHRMGDQKSSRVSLLWPSHMWSIRSPLGDQIGLTEHLGWLLDTLEPKSEVIHRLDSSCYVRFFCGFSSWSGQGGFTLEPAILTRLASLGVPFVMDLYAPSDVERMDEASTTEERPD